MKKLFLLLSILTLSSAWASVHKNIKYAPHERQAFDLWQPDSNKPTPLVIYIHGGGWAAGSKESINDWKYIIQQYNDAGVAFAAINYRFLKHAPLQKIMREDIGGFVQFMRFNAKRFNINKKKIMAFGVSAGGAASVWLATHDDLKDPTSENLYRRESSKIQAGGHINAQVSYDFQDWYDYFGAAVVDKYLKDQVWSRYHFKSKEDLYTSQGEEVRQFLDPYDNYDADDAPMFYFNTNKKGPMTNNDLFLHGPKHTNLLYRKAKEVGADAVMMLDGERPLDKKRSSFRECLKFFMKKVI